MSWNDLFQLYRQRFLSWRHSCAQIQRKLMQNTIDISRILSHSEFGFPNLPLTHPCLYTERYTSMRILWCVSYSSEKLHILPCTLNRL